VDARIDGDLSLEEMAQSVGLCVAHFSAMFRKSMGQSPHQFVLRHHSFHFPCNNSATKGSKEMSQGSLLDAGLQGAPLLRVA